MKTGGWLETALAAGGFTLMAAGIAAHAHALGAASAASVVARDAGQARQDTFAIVDARVFDGATVREHATVLVRSGIIAAVGDRIEVPKGVPVVNATGKTLLPGLIDAHTHAFGDALERALVFGVTTELDMFTDPKFAAARRDEQKRGLASSRADLLSAGVLATAPGGHGTEYGIAIPTLTRPVEAQAFVEARLAEGSDYIKIIYDDVAGFGPKRPTLDPATVAALVTAAHRRGKLAVVHITTCRAARDVVEAGVDGLAHAFSDEPADAVLVSLVRRRGVFVIPTMSVLASAAGDTSVVRAVAADPALAVYVGPRERESLDARFPRTQRSDREMPNLLATVAALKAAGVPLLAGTDAPNPGTAHGVSLHGEIELLVRAGLTPVEALAAATSVPARIFGLADRGRIARGLRADLLLVDGDPARDITATRRIAMVWKQGVPAARTPAPAVAPPAPVATDGLVSEFETDMACGFGSGWQISTDSMLGGTSEASMRVVAGGAQNSRGSLEISGRIGPGSMYPWAGAMFFPGAQPMAPANLSHFKELAFWAKGDGATYRVMVLASRSGNIPTVQSFTAGAAWSEVVLPLSGFGGTDGSDLRGILFSAGSAPGAFSLQIDSVRFR